MDLVISHILCGGTSGTNILYILPPSSAGAADYNKSNLSWEYNPARQEPG